jgi:hypothetical protein
MINNKASCAIGGFVFRPVANDSESNRRGSTGAAD